MNVSGISPWVVGQLGPIWTINLNQGSDGAVNLTGVTTGQLALWIYTVSGSGLTIYTKTGTGAGTFTITSTNPGQVTYQLASADVPSTPGNYAVRVVISFGGTAPVMTDYIPWTVQA